MDRPESLSHTTWVCKYHVVFIPKCRRRTLYAQLRRHLGEVFHQLARQKESTIEEGHLLPDHVHMLISIPPKYAVSQVIGFIKGQKCDPLGAGVWRASAQFYRATLLGAGLLRLDRRSRRSGDSRATFVGRKRRIAGWINSTLTRMNPLQGVPARRAALATPLNHL
jgi:REP element-mobilizing transposase RayT